MATESDLVGLEIKLLVSYLKQKTTFRLLTYQSHQSMFHNALKAKVLTFVTKPIAIAVTLFCKISSQYDACKLFTNTSKTIQERTQHELIFCIALGCVYAAIDHAQVTSKYPRYNLLQDSGFRGPALGLSAHFRSQRKPLCSNANRRALCQRRYEVKMNRI